MAVVVLVDAASTCVDIDARAEIGGRPSEVANLVSDACLALYTAELMLTVGSRGLGLVKDWMVLIDVVVIVCALGRKKSLVEGCKSRADAFPR